MDAIRSYENQMFFFFLGKTNITGTLQEKTNICQMANLLTRVKNELLILTKNEL